MSVGVQHLLDAARESPTARWNSWACNFLGLVAAEAVSGRRPDRSGHRRGLRGVIVPTSPNSSRYGVLMAGAVLVPFNVMLGTGVSISSKTATSTDRRV
jgi:hypothetical protein